MNLADKGVTSEVESNLRAYPAPACTMLLKLRSQIMNLAQEQQLGEVTESIKWGQASFSVLGGSPIRLDWNVNKPKFVSVFFNCQTSLVETFREIHPEAFTYVGNREVQLEVSKPLAVAPLNQCLSMALRYHKIKHLPLLGA